MTKKLSIVQKMALAAMLLIVDLIATRIAGAFSIPNFPFVRISFGPMVVIYSSLLLGPLFGAVVGAGADLLGMLLFAQGGPINFVITVIYGLLGVLPWLLALGTKRIRTTLKKPWVLYGALAVLWGLLLVLLFATADFDSYFGADPLIPKLIVAGVTFVLAIAMCVALYFENRYFQKRILDYADIPSPNEVALIALVCELTLMVLLKPVAFYFYYGYVFPYFYLVLCMIMISFVNVAINTFGVSWLFIFSKRFVHNYGYGDVKPADDPSAKDARAAKNLHVDESLLTEEDRKQLHPKAPIGWIVFFAVCLILVVVCMVVIFALGGPDSSSSSSAVSVASGVLGLLQSL